MRKTFKKFVRKTIEKENEGIAGELNKTIDDSMDEVVIHFYNSMIAQNMGGATLIAFLLEHPSNEKAIEGMNIAEAIKFAMDYQNEKEDEDKIVIKYDKGLFWYDIGEGSCSIEAERMGHCGDDARGRLYSWRSKRKIKKYLILMLPLATMNMKAQFTKSKVKATAHQILNMGHMWLTF